MVKSVNGKTTWNFYTNVVIHLKKLKYTNNELLGSRVK